MGLVMIRELFQVLVSDVKGYPIKRNEDDSTRINNNNDDKNFFSPSKNNVVNEVVRKYGFQVDYTIPILSQSFSGIPRKRSYEKEEKNGKNKEENPSRRSSVPCKTSTLIIEHESWNLFLHYKNYVIFVRSA